MLDGYPSASQSVSNRAREWTLETAKQAASVKRGIPHSHAAPQAFTRRWVAKVPGAAVSPRVRALRQPRICDYDNPWCSRTYGNIQSQAVLSRPLL